MKRLRRRFRRDQVKQDNRYLRVQAWATVGLVAVTVAYVILTWKLTDETRKGYEGTIGPFLVLGSDSLSKIGIDTKEEGGNRILRYEEYFSIENTGKTYGEIVIFIREVIKHDLDGENIRDTLLTKREPDSYHRFEDYGTLSNFVPPGKRTSYKMVLKFRYKLEDQIENTEKCYEHMLIIYKDPFGKYHDVYCVRQGTMDRTTRIVTYEKQSKYDFHDYSGKEIKRILKKEKDRMKRKQSQVRDN